MTDIIESLFSHCETLGASDIHIATDQPPRFRVQGKLAPRPEYATFDATTVDAIAMELGLVTLPIGCPDGTERIRNTLINKGSIDGALSSASGARYRFNLFRESGRTAIALRRLEGTFHPVTELGLPPRVTDFCNFTDGLVIVTGPTGSGKSTTLATLIDIINRSREGHIITIEDPIEFVHESQQCLMNQRQVGRDALGFYEALIEALRQDPDVILLGEIRDLKTVRTAITAAETGHLVFTTLHAGDCVGAIERFVSVFPAEEQTGIRHQLALILRGVLAQHLVPATDGTRSAVCEMLVNNSAIANLIATGRSAQIYSAIETGGVYGMVTLDQSLVRLVMNGSIEENVAYALAHNADSLRNRIAVEREKLNAKPRKW